MKQHELNELCIALRHEIYTLRRTINEQNKDLEKKDKLISNLAKQVNNNNKQQQKLIKSIKEVIDYLWIDEERHYSENEKPKIHIFKTLKTINKLINKTQLI